MCWKATLQNRTASGRTERQLPIQRRSSHFDGEKIHGEIDKKSAWLQCDRDRLWCEHVLHSAGNVTIKETKHTATGLEGVYGKAIIMTEIVEHGLMIFVFVFLYFR